MLSFKQFLSEQEDAVSIEEWVRKNCAPFLKECGCNDGDSWEAIWNKTALKRGSKNAAQNAEKISLSLPDEADNVLGFIKSVRKDRRPLDTERTVSKIVDNSLNQKFGWKARSQALFCKARGSISLYGLAYRVFPIGEFKYIWSPVVKDLTLHMRMELQSNKIPLDDGMDEGGFHGYNPEQQEQIAKVFDKELLPTYMDDNLELALKSNSEIMISCDKYMLIPQV